MLKRTCLVQGFIILSFLCSLISCSESTGLEPVETWPLAVSLSFDETAWNPGDRIAIGIYDSSSKIGTANYLVMTGQNFHNFYYEFGYVPASRVYLVAYKDNNRNYLLDGGEPYTIYDSGVSRSDAIPVDLRTLVGPVSIIFDETNIW